MKKWVFRISALLVAAFIAIQFVPVVRSNPPVASDAPMAGELKAVMRRACYDCHSNETVWPWYSYVAPFSRLLAKDVREGRRELNFSEWNQYAENRRARKLKEIVEQVEKGKMPQWYYVMMHPRAKLSASDKEMISKWAKQP
jgi:cytochrome c551/c552